MDDLTSDRARIDALRPIAIEDLLGREAIATDPELLGAGLHDAVDCITGAGTSVGCNHLVQPEGSCDLHRTLLNSMAGN